VLGRAGPHWAEMKEERKKNEILLLFSRSNLNAYFDEFE
jgi:hypothetical protein